MSIDYLTGRSPSPGKVNALIGGKAYFDDFFIKLSELEAGDKLFLLNWHIHPLFNKKIAPDDNTLDGRPSDKYLLTQLQDKVSAGVDVRILLWINTNLFEPLYPLSDIMISSTMSDMSGMPFKSIMNLNLETVYWWRNRRIQAAEGYIYEYEDDAGRIISPRIISHKSDQALKDRIVINTLDSMFGGCHAKFVLFLKRQPSGEFIGTGYTGGIDLAPQRYAKDPYTGFHKVINDDGSTIDGANDNFWHDIMAKVEGGNAVAPLFYFYRNLWNENVERKAGYNPKIRFEVDGSPIQVPCVPSGASLIEELDFDLDLSAEDHWVQSVSTIPDIYKISSEPEISFAKDGNFELRDSVHHAFAKAKKYIYVEDQAMESLELFGLLKEAIAKNSELRVILITMGDPADAPTEIPKKLINHFFYSKMTQEQKERLHFFQANYTIHSKLYIVDDQVAIIGSGGFITRSMTEELEHAITYIDNGGETIKGIRQRLWNLHTGVDFAAIPNIDAALVVWSHNDEFGNTDKYNSGAGLSRIDLDESAFIDISDFWQEIPDILKKKITGALLTDEEGEKLAYFDLYRDEQYQAILHRITHEIPYSSLLNPSRLPPVVGIPFLEKDKVAIHEKARLELISSQLSNIEWEYSGTDGTPQSGTGGTLEIQFSTPGLKIVRATQTFDEADIEQEYPFVLEVLENSGPYWVDRFPPSKDISDLSDAFRLRVEQFLLAVEDAGLTHKIVSTYRPPERAYLMAYAWKIAQGLHPAKVKERLANVNISWLHFGANGDFDLPASRQAAQTMVQKYNIGSTGAVYPTLHSEGNAIDMSIDIPSPVMMRNGKGELKRVAKQSDVSRIALSYDIKRLRTSSHWSLTGH